MKKDIEVEQSKDGILLVRKGWEEDAKTIATSGEKYCLIQDIFADEDLSWWKFDNL